MSPPRRKVGLDGMDREISKAQFVLMICTERYYRRVMGEEKSGEGLGIAWEGSLIYNRIYNSSSLNTRFHSINTRNGRPAKSSPTPLQGATRYCLDDEYEKLYGRSIGKATGRKTDSSASVNLSPSGRSKPTLQCCCRFRSIQTCGIEPTGARQSSCSLIGERATLTQPSEYEWATHLGVGFRK